MGIISGQRLGEWTKNYGSAATERKIYVGKGIRYFSNIGVAEFLVEAAELNVGDKLLITGPTTGAVFTTLDEARRLETGANREERTAFLDESGQNTSQ